MTNSPTSKLSPSKLRLMLIGLMLLIVVVCAIGFWFFREQLTVYADQVRADSAAAEASTDDIAQLQKLKEQLENDQVAVARAKKIVADSKFYAYQVDIIHDLTTYANEAGISIVGFTFNNENVSSSSSGSSSTPESTPESAPTSAPDPGSASSGEAPAIAGLKTTSVSIAIQSPVQYKAYMTFLRSIELNLTKMEIAGVSLSKGTDDPNTVTVSPLSIEVYTR